MIVIKCSADFPETGEWVMSPKPNDFVVCLDNDTGILPEIDRIAYAFSLGAQGEADADGKMTTEIKVLNVYSVEGKLPKDQIPPTDESKAILEIFNERVGLAVDQWTGDTTEEEKEDFWALSAKSMPVVPRLADILSSILGRAKGEQ